MWETLSAPWQACLEQAWQAYRAGSIPIGAAICGPDGRVLSTGRNRLKEPRQASLGFLAGMRLAHAEMNALLAWDYSGNPRECTLYTTTEPCPMCAGALVMANIRRVCYAARDPWAGATGLYRASPYLRRKQIAVLGPEAWGPDGRRLEALLFGLQGDFFIREALQRGERRDSTQGLGGLLAEMSIACPHGILLAERLFTDGRLVRMAAAGEPARVMIDELARDVEALALAEQVVTGQ